MNKIMCFVQPIRLGHVTSHTSTPASIITNALHHHWHPSASPASLTFAPLTTTFMTCQNTATMAKTHPPQRHVIAMHQEHKPTTMGRKRTRHATGDRAEGTREGRGAHKGQRVGCTRYTHHFFLFYYMY